MRANTIHKAILTETTFAIETIIIYRTSWQIVYTISTIKMHFRWTFYAYSLLKLTAALLISDW